MAFDLNNPYAQAYINVGRKFGASPAFISASLGNSWDESRWDAANRSGDQGAAYGGMQWNSKYSPDRVAGLMNTAKELNKPWTDPEVQATWWYKENQGNLGATDINQANDAVVNSLRPAGWKKGDPTGVPTYNSRKNNSLELFNMLSKGQDPRSFMALGSDSMPQVGGEQPQAPQSAQSISLGNEEQQPFNNIGSTLANMGASIASLDNRGTGIASLNASRVASNLQQQEQQRAAEGGWKYAGQTQNGQGLMFQNSKGEVRVEPLAPGFTGEKEPETIRTLKMLRANPSLMETLKEKNGSTSETPALTEDDYSRLLDKEMAGGKLGTPEFGTGKDSNANRIGYQKFKTENLKRFGLNEDDLAKAATNSQFRGKIARDLGGTEIKFTQAYNNFMAGSQVLEEYAKNYPREWPKIIEAARQGSVLGLNIPGIGADQLAKLDTAFDTTAIEYAKAKNPQNSNLTLSEMKEAGNKFRATMGNEELFGRLSAMRRELDSNKDRMMKLHESVIGPHVTSPLASSSSAEPQQSGGKQPTIRNSAKAPSNISNQNDLMNWIQSSGLKRGDKFTLPDGTEGTVP